MSNAVNDSIESMDLNYLREVAESGQSAPLLGGRFLAWWGGLTTIAYAGHWAIASGFIGVGEMAYGLLWSAFLLLGIGGQIVLVRTFPESKPGIASVGNRAERVVWQASGFAMFAYFATLMLKSYVSGAGSMGFAWSFAVVFMIYGIGLITTGALGESQLLHRAGIVALCVVPFAAWFAGTEASWLFASIGAGLCMFVPGVLMMKHEPTGVE